MRIGILTSGGDCPGINATIRGVCKTAINYYGMEVVGIHSGFQGLLTKDVESKNYKNETEGNLHETHHLYHHCMCLLISLFC